MKIKFIKEYRAIPLSGGIDNDWGCYKDEVKDTHDDQGQWLIDNGFAEEVKESGWGEPQNNEEYFFVNSWGAVFTDMWDHSTLNCGRLSIGNCFKTQEAAERYCDYLKAIATVRQDEGVLTPDQLQEKERDDKKVVFIGFDSMGHLATNSIGLFSYDIIINAILFDNETHAQASLDNHPDEWKIIANYDWSRE